VCTLVYHGSRKQQGCVILEEQFCQFFGHLLGRKTVWSLFDVTTFVYWQTNCVFPYVAFVQVD